MANRLWSLYRSLLNVHYGWSFNKYYYIKKRRRIWEPILIVALLVPFLLGMIIALWKMTESLYMGGLAFAQPHLALVYGAILVLVLGLFYGFFYVLSAFYFSSDLSILLALPLESREILLAKLGVVLTGQYLANAIMLGPIWLKYGLLAKVGWSYLFSAVLVFMLLPIIPLVIASLFAVLLMRFVNLSRHKDKLTLIGGLLMLVIVFGFQIWVYLRVGDDPEMLLTTILSQSDGLVRIASRVFPTALWAAQTMAYPHLGQGWLNLAYLAGVSVLGLGILYLVGEKVFIQSLLLGLEGDRGGKAKKISLSGLKTRSTLWALALTEIKLFIRNPGYALNGLIGYILFPFFAVLPLFTKSMPQNPFDFLAGRNFPSVLILGGIAIFFFFMTAISGVSATTFSREGKLLWLMRSLPCSIHKVMAGRVLAAQLINTIGCLVGVAALSLVFRWPLAAILGGIALGIPLAVALSYLLTLLDLWRPMLDWVNPIKAVKSNLNVLIGLFGSIFLGIGLGVRFYANFSEQRLWLIPLELILLTIFLIIVARYLSKKFAHKLWRSIEGGS